MFLHPADLRCPGKPKHSSTRGPEGDGGSGLHTCVSQDRLPLLHGVEGLPANISPFPHLTEGSVCPGAARALALNCQWKRDPI